MVADMFSLRVLRRFWVGAGLLALLPGVAVANVFSGYVTDAQGRPVANARVEVNDQALGRTDARGEYKIRTEQARRYVINISHPDFADISYISRRPLENVTWCLVRAQIEMVDASRGIRLLDRRSTLENGKQRGASLVLPANALVDPNDEPVRGMVRAAIATLDIERGQAPGDWAVRSENGQGEGYLLSYGAVFVRFTDPSGRVEYQLGEGQAAEVALPVTASMEEFAAETREIAVWYYDKQDGDWKKNGSAEFDRGRRTYVGKVNHLSTINTDIAKFDDAACLQITLDSSVPLGSKLRIRYHSAGTAFGQTPTFIMNDTINAAYRLPANTNVLFELFDASDVPYGNLVVEDPPGTPVINNVVNTGPAIPPGGDLWPPFPYAGCKPVVLKLGEPEVEIQINALVADPERDIPIDDYLTWAPTFCRARLKGPMPANVDVVLTNDNPVAILDGGNVRFAPFASPWPVNTTATANTLALTLPADGSWEPFVMSGEFGSPSHNDEDTIVEAHQDTAAGAILGTKALMVRVRKNANEMADAERDRFLFAMKALRNKGGSGFLMFQELHRLASTAGDEAHRQPAFFPWHRALLLHVERELQAIDPSVTLPYWNWDAAAPNIFSEDFMGAPGTGGFFIAEPVFALGHPFVGWDTDLPFSGGELRRNMNDHTRCARIRLRMPRRTATRSR